MSGKKLLSFGKKFFIVVGVITGILLIMLLIAYITEPEIKVSNLKITNLTDSSATVSWTSAEPSVGTVLVSESSRFDILTNFKKVRFFDDRDTDTYTWLLSVTPPERYTHHVTITNLSPESKYYYRVAGMYRTVDTTYPVLETLPILDTLTTPDPMYGSFLLVANPDSIVYATLNNGLELSTYLNDSNSFSLDKTSARVSYKEGDTINIRLQSKDTFVTYEGIVGEDQPLDLTKIKDAGNTSASSVKGLTASLIGEVSAACQCGAGTVSCGGSICGPDGHKYNCTSENNFHEDGLCGSSAPAPKPVNTTTPTPTTQTPVSTDCGNMKSGQSLCNPDDKKSYSCDDGKLTIGGSCGTPAAFNPESTITNVEDLSIGTCAKVSSGDYCGADGNLYNCSGTGAGSLKTKCSSCKKNNPGVADVCEVPSIENVQPSEGKNCSDPVNYVFHYSCGYCVKRGTIDVTKPCENVSLTCEKDKVVRGCAGGVVYKLTYTGNKKSDGGCDYIHENDANCSCNGSNGYTCNNGTVKPVPALLSPTGSETKTANKVNFTITTPAGVTISDSCFCGKADDGSIFYRCGQIATDSNGMKFGCANNTVITNVSSVATDGDVGIQSNTKLGAKMDFKDNFLKVWNQQTSTVLIPCGDGSKGIVGKIGDPNPWTNDCTKPNCTDKNAPGCAEFKPKCTDIKDGKIVCTFDKAVVGPTGVLPAGCTVSVGSCPTSSLLNPVNASAVLGISTTSSVTVNETGIYKISGIDGYTITTDTVKVVDQKAGGVEIKFFYDLNGDGIKQDNEQYVTEPLQVNVDKVSDISTLDLKVGWNLIGDTTVVTSLTTAKDLINEISKQGGYATHVSTYRNGKWVLYSQRAGVELGNNFNLIPGEGYFVKVYKAVKLVLEGKKMLSGASSYYMSNGWNLISLVPDTGMKASGLLDKINKNSSLVSDVVTRYQSGRYENLVKDSVTTYGNDFPLSSVEGYFVRLTKGGSVLQL